MNLFGLLKNIFLFHYKNVHFNEIFQHSEFTQCSQDIRCDEILLYSNVSVNNFLESQKILIISIYVLSCSLLSMSTYSTN